MRSKKTGVSCLTELKSPLTAAISSAQIFSKWKPVPPDIKAATPATADAPISALADAASTDIQVHPIGRYADEGFEVILGGDCELETMIRALKFITQVLEEEAEEVYD